MSGTAAVAPQAVAPPDDEICRLSATALVRLLRARELSAVELLDRVLTQADEVADVVNPFSVRLDDAARGVAQEADRLRASEHLGFVPVDDDVRRARRVVTGLIRAGVDVVADNPGLSSLAAARATIACAEARWSEATEYERCANLLSPEVRDYPAFGEGYRRGRTYRRSSSGNVFTAPTPTCSSAPGRTCCSPPPSGVRRSATAAATPRRSAASPSSRRGCTGQASLRRQPCRPARVRHPGERWQDPLVLGAAETIESVLATAPPTGPAGLERQET
jgi:hypothetical protein